MREKPDIVRNRVLVANSYLLKFMFPESSRVNITTNVAVIIYLYYKNYFSFQQFQRLSWQREFAMYGVNISSKLIDSPERYLDVFTNHLISPLIIVSLCRSYKRDFNGTLLLYAIHLCASHTSKKINKRTQILDCARQTLDLIVNPTDHIIRQLLLAVDQRFSPYDYEPIEVALEWCRKYVKDAELADLIHQMQNLIGFLR